VRTLDLGADPVDLCAALVDVPSVSGDEGALASALETALRAQAPHLRVQRSGHAVLARTELGRDKRVLLAGHIDTVPIVDNVPSHVDGDRLYGCGTSDMKAGVAVQLKLAALLPEPAQLPVLLRGEELLVLSRFRRICEVQIHDGQSD
jgi:succinyl-diaminopimelate desuccinylase